MFVVLVFIVIIKIIAVDVPITEKRLRFFFPLSVRDRFHVGNLGTKSPWSAAFRDFRVHRIGVKNGSLVDDLMSSS